MAGKELNHAFVGPAGEHFVLFRLYQLGILASRSPPNWPMVDILILSDDRSVIATLQVKTTRTGARRGWPMGKKDEASSVRGHFYAFVDLVVPPGALPVTYIIPSEVVADVLKQSHEIWMKTAGKGGRVHRDSPVRQILPVYRSIAMPKEYHEGWLEKYREDWKQLLQR